MQYCGSNGWEHSWHDESHARHCWISVEYIVPCWQIFMHWSTTPIAHIWAIWVDKVQKVGQAWQAPSMKYDGLHNVGW
jgi:hypothetical protein